MENVGVIKFCSNFPKALRTNLQFLFISSSQSNLLLITDVSYLKLVFDLTFIFIEKSLFRFTSNKNIKNQRVLSIRIFVFCFSFI